MVETQTDLRSRVVEALSTVPDPEIPTLSIVDLGILEAVDALGNGGIRVTLLPTFSGCPALDTIESESRRALAEAGFNPVDVSFDLKTPYSSNRITNQGRQKLLEWGITPPSQDGSVLLTDDLSFLDHVACPRCGSSDTLMRSPFGPALCRSLHLCRNCGEGFESFKPI
jgi:ring-1,2-phenylacetyl-CoA epoxidase subunit PaaD